MHFLAKRHSRKLIRVRLQQKRRIVQDGNVYFIVSRYFLSLKADPSSPSCNTWSSQAALHGNPRMFVLREASQEPSRTLYKS